MECVDLAEGARSRTADRNALAGLSALWESNFSAPIKANVDKFKQSLSTEEIEIIETLTGELMQYYGYERMTPGRASLSKEEVDGRRATPETRRQEAWTTLHQAKHQDFWLRHSRADYLSGIRERLSRTPHTLSRATSAFPRVAH